MRRTKVKFCGCRSERDVEDAVAAGADAVGFVLTPSPRRINLDVAARLMKLVPSDVTPVAIFIAPTRAEVRSIEDLRDDFVLQISTNGASAHFPTLLRVVRTVQIDDKVRPSQIEAALSTLRDDIVLFDTKVGRLNGGTGHCFPWKIVAPFVRRQRSFIAGGLTAENVGRCIRMLRPIGVDVSSGIETQGFKDVEKMRRFIAAVEEADES